MKRRVLSYVSYLYPFCVFQSPKTSFRMVFRDMCGNLIEELNVCMVVVWACVFDSAGIDMKEGLIAVDGDGDGDGDGNGDFR